MFFTVNAAIVGYALSKDTFAPDDVGNAFERLQSVSDYAVDRLDAATREQPLPRPPLILADQRDLQYILLVTLASQLVVVGVVVYASRQSWEKLVAALRLDEFHPGRTWLILGVVALVYFALFLYSLGAEATGISWLEPKSTVPGGVTRNDFTLTITGVITLIGAPISEELFFRGLLFSGLVRWGFWPAALLSGAAFSIVHFDPGSLVPFLGIAVVLAWVYWRRGSLWDSMAFHFFFNAISLSIMVATR